MTDRQQISPHPLDDCDEDECYKTMMAERTVLVAAQREAEDNLVKTVVQLASALIALMAGFVSQANVTIEGASYVLFSSTMVALGLAICMGLAENFYSSRAYREQQTLLEDYYGKLIDTFESPKANKYVRRTQVAAFTFFVSALCLMGAFALVEAKGKSNVGRQTTTATATASSSSPSPAASSPARSSSEPRRRLSRSSREVGGTLHASPATQEAIGRETSTEAVARSGQNK